MIELLLRSKTDAVFVLPLARCLQRHAFVSANMITLLACLFGLLVIPALYFQHEWVAVGLLLASGYCDMLDGVFARLQQRQSSLGSYLDILADRVVEFAVIVGICLVDPQFRGFYGLLMIGSVLICVTSFLLVGIFSEQESDKSFYYSPGLVERVEAFGFFITMILMPQWFTLLAVLFTTLVMLTAAIRTFEFIQA